MEAIIVVLRPKQISTVSQQFLAEVYEIMLLNATQVCIFNHYSVKTYNRLFFCSSGFHIESRKWYNHNTILALIGSLKCGDLSIYIYKASIFFLRRAFGPTPSRNQGPELKPVWTYMSICWRFQTVIPFFKTRGPFKKTRSQEPQGIRFMIFMGLR